MNSNDIVADARLSHLRELKRALAETKDRLQKTEAELRALLAHFPLAMAAIRDLGALPPGGVLRIVDGWNAVLKLRNVAKLSSEDVSRLKKEYLARLGISDLVEESRDLPVVDTWIIFDGSSANSGRSGSYRITYTGGTGLHRADRMILDYVNAAKILGMDISRIVVETADKDLSKRLADAGVKVE